MRAVSPKSACLFKIDGFFDFISVVIDRRFAFLFKLIDFAKRFFKVSFILFKKNINSTGELTDKSLRLGDSLFEFILLIICRRHYFFK
ncbi:MAG: hypothetical protein C0606_07350 [Hyphomicrobiales bacterium]|nr:MAG: hypothetical protein C0606_07350 [Hyphomicrobiales bacterium]